MKTEKLKTMEIDRLADINKYEMISSSGRKEYDVKMRKIKEEQLLNKDNILSGLTLQNVIYLLFRMIY